MSNVSVIYGSSTGNTQLVAEQIAANFGVSAVNISDATKDDFSAELLILGSSTWGFGELQDDWAYGIDKLNGLDLSNTKVAVFGTGDQSGFGDTFCDAIGIIAEKAQSCGATLVGQTSVEGYNHSSSVAECDGQFCGLALDFDNEPELNDSRIEEWLKTL